MQSTHVLNCGKKITSYLPPPPSTSRTAILPPPPHQLPCCPLLPLQTWGLNPYSPNCHLIAILPSPPTPPHQPTLCIYACFYAELDSISTHRILFQKVTISVGRPFTKHWLASGTYLESSLLTWRHIHTHAVLHLIFAFAVGSRLVCRHYRYWYYFNIQEGVVVVIGGRGFSSAKTSSSSSSSSVTKNNFLGTSPYWRGWKSMMTA